MLVQLAGNGAFALQAYLFGSITTISYERRGRLGRARRHRDRGRRRADAAAVRGLARRGVRAGQRLTGRFYNMLVAVLAAVTVERRDAHGRPAAGQRPDDHPGGDLAAVRPELPDHHARGDGSAGSLASLGGVVVSALRSTSPPGATIVLLALAGFVADLRPSGWSWLADGAATVPFDADATRRLHARDRRVAIGHEHGPGCGHLAVEHGDHVDYVHDGHRHAVHVTGEGRHYDEH